MSNLGKPGCKECRVRPGGRIRVDDKGHCKGCGEPVHTISVVPAHPGPLRDDRGPSRPWRPSEAA